MPATRRVQCKRNRKQLGGGLGSTYGFPTSSANLSGMHISNNPLVASIGSSCMAAKPGSWIEGGHTGFGGLPGMKGGKRSTKKSRKTSKKSRKTSKKSRKTSKKSNKQSGGSYSIAEYDGTVMGVARTAGISPIHSTGCSAGSQTPIPDHSATLNTRASYLWDGPSTQATQRGGADSMTVPTAGYSQLSGTVPQIQTAAGTLAMVNEPANARDMNPACLKTGGSRRKNAAKSKSKKSRKTSKKSKKSKSRK